MIHRGAAERPLTAGGGFQGLPLSPAESDM